MPSYTGIIKL